MNPLSERTQLILLPPIIVPVMVVAAPPLFAMGCLLWAFSKWDDYRSRKSWHQWFAWHPVNLDGWCYDRPSKWVWLETVERRRWGGWEP